MSLMTIGKFVNSLLKSKARIESVKPEAINLMIVAVDRTGNHVFSLVNMLTVLTALKFRFM